jgi:hypothetical protein
MHRLHSLRTGAKGGVTGVDPVLPTTDIHLVQRFLLDVRDHF